MTGSPRSKIELLYLFLKVFTYRFELRPLVPLEYVASKRPQSVGNNGSVDLNKRSRLEERLDALSAMSSTPSPGTDRSPLVIDEEVFSEWVLDV